MNYARIAESTESSLSKYRAEHCSRLVALTHERWFIPLVTLFCLLPMLFAPVLPLVDLGGHIGRYAIQLDAGRSPALARWYSFEWNLLPNLGVDLLVQLIGPFVGIEPAARIAVILAVALQSSGILMLSRRLHGRITPWAIVALPLIYSFPFNFGFINFALSLGLSYWAMIAWMHLEKSPGVNRWFAFAAIATVIWICHMVGWATFCILAGSRELTLQWQKNGAKIEALARTALTVSCLLVPVAVGMLFGPQGGETGPTQGWLQIGWKLLLLIDVLLDRWLIFDQASATFVFAMLIWAALVPEVSGEKSMKLAASIMAACALVMPTQALGSHYADVRLFPIALTLALLALSTAQSMPERVEKNLLWLACAFAFLRFTATLVAGQATGREMERELALLESLPQHAQMAVLRARECDMSVELKMDRTTHLAGYAIARRQAFSNDQWQVAGAQLLKIHNPDMAPFESDPSQFTHNRPCGGDIGIVEMAKKVPAAATHLWVFWDGRPQPLPGWKPIRQGSTSVLYTPDD